MILQEILLPLAIAAIAGVAGQFLNSPLVKEWISLHGDKLAAEAAALTATTQANNNNILRSLVGIAMSYAETHEADILTKFKSKADFVIARITSDPRFASLGVPLDSVELVLEDIWESYFQHLNEDETEHH